MPRDGLRGIVTRNLKNVHWQAFDIHGLPNLNGCLEGKEFWVHCVVTTDFHARVPRSLAGWFKRRGATRGRIFVFIERTSLRGAYRGSQEVDELWILDGRYASYLTASLKKLPKRAVIGVWDGGPRGWDWQAIRQAIVCAR